MSVEKGPPFYETPVPVRELHEEGSFSVLNEFKNNPKWLIKSMDHVNDTIYHNWLAVGAEEGSEIPELTFERFEIEVGKTKKILDGSKSGIASFIPESHLVFGENESGRKMGFIVTERVLGEDLLYIKQATPEINESFEQFLLTALDFYDEQKVLGQGFFPDIVTFPDKDEEYEIHNLMYGYTSTKEKQIFLVDTYPLMHIYNDRDPYFDELKRALENYYVKNALVPGREIRERLAGYGRTALETRIRISVSDNV